LNEPGNDGYNALWYCSRWKRLALFQDCIASGRDVDLGVPGNEKTDIIGAAREGKTRELVPLLERFQNNPEETRRAVRREIGWYDREAAEVFALVVFLSDGLLRVGTEINPAARFFSIASQLPLELQGVLCFRLVDSAKVVIPKKVTEKAFRYLAKRIILLEIPT